MQTLERSNSQIDNFLAEINTTGVARTNKFEVKLNPPTIMTGDTRAETLVLRCESVSMPGLNLATATDNNIYGPTRDIVEGVTFADEIAMVFLLDRNHTIRQFFTEWMEQAYDKGTWNVKYYNEYASGTADIFQLDEKHNQVYGIKVWECYPKNFGPIEYSSSSTNEIAKLTVNFNFRHWTDISIDGDKQPTDLPKGISPADGASF
jgi:hypothetical protein